MLQHLYIKHFLFIESLEIDFYERFCVVMGETGAGRSMLLDASLEVWRFILLPKNPMRTKNRLSAPLTAVVFIRFWLACTVLRAYVCKAQPLGTVRQSTHKSLPMQVFLHGCKNSDKQPTAPRLFPGGNAARAI